MTAIRRTVINSPGTCSSSFTPAHVSLPCEPWETPWVRPVIPTKAEPLPLRQRIEAARVLKAGGLTARQIAEVLGITEYEANNVLYRKSERRCGVCACRLTEANTSGVCRKHNHAAGVCKCARCAA